MKCPKHPDAVMRYYLSSDCKGRWLCMECRRVQNRITGEFQRVKAFVRRMGYLEGLEKY